MVCACIDIGSNTTRVLVAEAERGGVRALLQERSFTRVGRALTAAGAIPRAKIEEVAGVVARQRGLAEQLGAGALRAVATAAVRGAVNRDEVVEAVRDHCGVELAVLDGEEEARLAFLGATRTLGQVIDGPVGVVDVGGGSTEIAVGTVEGGVTWWRSLPVGSSVLTERHLRGDPPRREELDAMAAEARAVLSGVDVPAVECAVAVGGSATSLCRLAGNELSDEALARALAVLAGAPAAEIAVRHDIELERVPLLPGGIVVLRAVAERLGRAPAVGRGGLREGVVLDLARSHDVHEGGADGAMMDSA
jgi:exopolyphosphatase/guanosine-5'-triphosphate,3'-diphosphate pyrophosphatase